MLKYFFTLILLSSFLYAQDIEQENPQDYTLGEGLQVGSLPLYIGGYISAEYKEKEHLKQYSVDDIALLAYGDYEKLSYMAEFEYKELYTHTQTEYDTFTKQDRKIYLERLYGDYQYDENHKIRVGKFNSPIGFWNLLPINVLRETTSNPEVTEEIFPKFTTGLNFIYNSYSQNELQIDVIAQHNDDLDYNYNNYHVDEHLGVGVTYTISDLSLKANLGSFDNLLKNGSSELLYYALIALKYETQEYQIMSEFGSQYSSYSTTKPYVGYLQGAYRLTQKHSAILRLELDEDGITKENENRAIFAYTYRPLYPVAFKAEYQLHSKEYNNQLLFSMSVLF